jgi:hypothetical protein
MKIEPVELVCVRARLIPLEEAHIPSLYETGHDAELWKYSALRGMTLEEMSHLVHTLLAQLLSEMY